jgi:type I restriction enzyme, S subunit
MDSVLMKNKTLNLDKSNWQRTKLGDLATEISKRIDNPRESKYDRFVGLENFVSGDVKIRTWKTTKNLTSSAKEFQVGDVLFARRNAYLRRASLADFDGCCSGDAFVLRENHDKVVPGLLAFLMNTNTLWDFAISNAAGTMSKRVKWRDLSEYEFLLPPKKDQTKLAELLWAVNEVIEKDNKILNNLHTLVSSVRKKEISELKGDKVLLDEIIFPMSKIEVGKIEKSKYNENGKYPIIDQSLDFISGYSDDQSLVYKGDLPVIVFGDHTTILKFVDFPFVMGADGTKVIKPKNINVYYLFQLLLNLNIKPEGYKRHFSILKSKAIEVINDEKLIERFNNRMLNIGKSIYNCEAKISSTRDLQKNLINQIF